jgi:hypothetical protein
MRRPCPTGGCRAKTKPIARNFHSAQPVCLNRYVQSLHSLTSLRKGTFSVQHKVRPLKQILQRKHAFLSTQNFSFSMHSKFQRNTANGSKRHKATANAVTVFLKRTPFSLGLTHLTLIHQSRKISLRF